MDLAGILGATLLIGGIGLFIGLFLGLAGMAFRVEVDEKEEAVLAALPGNNCGGCGFPGCAGLASAIAKGTADVGACPVGGNAVAKNIAKIMGLDCAEKEREVAFVRCAGDCDKTHRDYQYTGISECWMVGFVPNGGPKSCNDGCMGFGTCVKACPFGAIHIENQLAVVDQEACKACGKCVEACPKHLITMIPYDAKYAVACSSKVKGPATMKVCSIGCIGCGICVKNCPNQAVTVTDFHASIDQSKCSGCGICAEKCPKKVIQTLQ